MNLVDRVQKLFVAPTEEWAVIKAETHTVVGLYTQYVMILAAIPAVASFIGWSVVGFSGIGTTYRVPIAAGPPTAVIPYVPSRGSLYALALVIDQVPPHLHANTSYLREAASGTLAFGFRSDRVQCAIHRSAPSPTPQSVDERRGAW